MRRTIIGTVATLVAVLLIWQLFGDTARDWALRAITIGFLLTMFWRRFVIDGLDDSTHLK